MRNQGMTTVTQSHTSTARTPGVLSPNYTLTHALPPSLARRHNNCSTTTRCINQPTPTADAAASACSALPQGCVVVVGHEPVLELVCQVEQAVGDEDVHCRQEGKRAQ